MPQASAYPAKSSPAQKYLGNMSWRCGYIIFISMMIAKRCERHGLQLIQPKAVSGPQILSSLPSGPKGKRTERKRHRTQNPLFFHGKKTTGKDKKICIHK